MRNLEKQNERLHQMFSHDFSSIYDSVEGPLEFEQRRDANPFKTLRILRTCPRCGDRNYHAARCQWVGLQRQVAVNCTKCGHNWAGRFRREEWE